MPMIDVKGVKLHYEEHGKGDPIVMVHGLGGSIFDWVMQIPYFSKTYRVIAVEMRDHGESDKWTGAYDIKMFSDDLAEVVNRLRLGKTIIFGLSMGGMIVMQFVLDHPDMARALVLADTPYGLTEETIEAGLEMASMSQKMSGKELAVATMKFNFSPEFMKTHPDMVEKAIKISDARDPSSTFRSAQGLASFDLRKRLREIKVPTLIANGEEDHVVPVSMANYLKDHITGAKLVILSRGRHMAVIEKADQFNKAASGFLKSIEEQQ